MSLGNGHKKRPFWVNRTNVRLSLKSARNRVNRERYWSKLVGNRVKDWPRTWLAHLLLAERRINEQHGAELTAVKFIWKETKWLCVVEKTYRGDSLIAFADAPGLRDAFYLVGEALGAKRLRWRKSKYGGKRGR